MVGAADEDATTWTLTDRRNGGDDLSQLQLVQNGSLTRGIETNLIQGRIASGTAHETEKSYHKNSWRDELRQKLIVGSAMIRTHFLFAKEAREQTRHGETHDGSAS
jgi:hypothetical protein